MKRIAVVMAGSLFTLVFTRAEVSLPAILSDNMVLQQNASLRIWGWADPGERVTVKLGTQEATAVAKADRSWDVLLEPIASSEPLTMTVAGENVITVRNILVGEVWVGAGQSNMWWPVSRTTNASEEIKAAIHPKLRLFTVPVQASREPLADIPHPLKPTQPETPPIAYAGRWVECTPETVAGFSGVGYYFGRDLQHALDAPVGIIAMAVGGSVAEAWTSEETLSEDPECNRLVEYWMNYEASLYPEKQALYEQNLKKWNADKSLEGPSAPIDPWIYVNRTGSLYNGMVSPIVRFVIRGVFWYQGESNASQAHVYSSFLKALITDWQKAWGIGPIPFLIVQLPNVDASKFPSVGEDWPVMREAQSQALDLPGTGLVVTIDLGEANDLHPPNKQAVSSRLVRLALALTYGKSIPHTGPRYRSMSIEGARIRLSFDHVGSGLKAKDGRLPGFIIAGRDARFVTAEAKIDGDDIVVWNSDVPDPVAVRYAWANDPDVSLFNKEGFPSAPFRTDSWPSDEVKGLP